MNDNASGKDATVLIVEDNEDNRLIYTTYLEHAGYRVIEAGDGAAGLELARAHLPDIILMDVSLPVMDGLEATRQLRLDPATCKLCVIVITAHAMASDRQAAVDAGADGYLAKPIEPRGVLEEVRRRLAHLSEG
jgi:CheY-like chemotaxis protein